MTIHEFNKLNNDEKQDLLQRCCGSTSWVNKMLEVFPVSDEEELYKYAEEKWNECSEADFREAVTHHPKIGDVKSLTEKFAPTAQWAAGEQAAVQQSSQKTIEALATANADYEANFGYIFIVCATGKSAEEMLAILQARLPNKPEDEIKIAASEQAKITRLRLEKLFA